jgi:transposase InsO family protein
MDEAKRAKRPRRSFTDDFKAGAIRLVLDEGKTVMQVARDLDLTASALRQWVERARADRRRKRIMRLMRAEGLRARVRRRYRCTTMSEHDQPIAPNLLGRNFQPATRNQSWASDTTELVIGSGKLYLAAVLDLYSRFVVGWAVSAVNDRHLVIKALDMALRRRCPGAGLLHHSDQGSPYASEDYQHVLEAHGIACSMSRRGNCYDNVVVRAGSRRSRPNWAHASTTMATRRTSYSITSRCSTTSTADTRPSATSASRVREGSGGEAGSVVQLSTELDQLRTDALAQQMAKTHR